MNCIFTWNGYISLLPTIGSIIRTYCLWQSNMKLDGRYDEDIIEEGINQAIKTSHIVKDLNIDLIICSPMKRTKHTMELVNVNNIDVIYDDRLIVK